MTAAVAGPAPPSALAQSAAAPPSGLRTERGITTIAPAVVEKIAGRAATEIEGVGVVAPAGLRRFFSSTPSADSPADADARVGLERASVALTISVMYPAPVRSTSARVREIVARRVKELTGLEVSWIDVTVAQLPMTEPWQSRRRVE